MGRQTKRFYEFGSFRLDPQRFRLLREGDLVPLSRKDIETLIVLVQKRGEVLTREELLQAVWNDAFVEDASLTVAISHLRKALNQKSDDEGFIETIPRKGYCFIADVREVSESSPSLIVEKHTRSTTVIEEEFVAGDSTSSVPDVRTRTQMLPIMLAAVLSLVVTGSFYFWSRGANNSALGLNSGIRSIAVLPPETDEKNAEGTSLSLGFANALTSKFTGVSNFSARLVTGTNRDRHLSGDSLAIGKKLDVDAIVDGHLNHSDNKVSISLRLLNIRTGEQIWEGHFEDTTQKLLQLEDRAASEIATALSFKLNGNEQSSLTKHLTTNHDAYAAYLKANYYWSQRGDLTAKSIPYYGKAIELDPQFAEAYLGLANVYALGGRWAEARVLVDKALALKPTLADAHATYGFLSMFQNWQWENAEVAFDRAIQLNPNSAHAHHWKGVYLSLRGRLPEAKQAMQRALELDPYSLIITADLGQLYYFSHDYDQAIEYCNRALAMDDEFQLARMYLVDIYLMKGMEQEAFETLARHHHLDQKSSWRSTFKSSGWRGILNEQLNTLIDPKDSLALEKQPLAAAKIYAAMGNGEQALRYLEKAFDQHVFWLPAINVDPYYDSLRQHPRFQNIVQRMGL